MEWLTNPEIWTGLFTLTLLEIVLGVDNIVFISILAGKLPADQQKRAWNTGLILALIPRLVLLAGIGFLYPAPAADRGEAGGSLRQGPGTARGRAVSYLEKRPGDP
jgi:predicted tellurium resistance membrane protein TerC